MPPSGSDSVATSEELRQKFIEILKDNGISDEVKEVLIREPPELQGEHMATATVYAQVTFKDDSVKPKNLFVKKFSSNEMHTEMIKKCRIMEKESSFFNDFLPYARQFCLDSVGENLLEFFPKCLYGDDEMVVLENVVLDDGFVMLPKEELQDEFTAKVVIRHLAKLHAVTYAITQKMGVDEFRKKWELNVLEAFDINVNPIMDTMFDNGVNTCINIIKLQGEAFEDAEYTINTLASYMGSISPLIQKCYKGSDDTELVALNHGDCWNNNMLFKKDPETGKVSEHIFVDLQITRFGSPTLDLGVKPEVRKNKVKELLQFYYEEFNKTAGLFGLKCPITFEKLLLEYKNHCAPGFFVALSLLSAIGAMKEISMDDFGSDMEEAMKIFNQAITDWIERNPDIAKTIAGNITTSVREYETIQSTW